eukprot:10074-Rhodomonas_salina.1
MVLIPVASDAKPRDHRNLAPHLKDSEFSRALSGSTLKQAARSKPLAFSPIPVLTNPLRTILGVTCTTSDSSDTTTRNSYSDCCRGIATHNNAKFEMMLFLQRACQSVPWYPGYLGMHTLFECTRKVGENPVFGGRMNNHKWRLTGRTNTPETRPNQEFLKVSKTILFDAARRIVRVGLTKVPLYPGT